MNIAGKNYRLMDCTRDYESAKATLVDEGMQLLSTERAKFALYVLSLDNPISYLEAIVRNEIGSKKSNSIKK